MKTKILEQTETELRLEVDGEIISIQDHKGDLRIVTQNPIQYQALRPKSELMFKQLPFPATK